MKSLILKYFKNKKICILGYGREGKSSLKTILKYIPEADITIADALETIKIETISDNIKIKCGSDYSNNLDDYDIIMKSPGIPENILYNIDNNKITSQTDLFLAEYNKQIIGVTGTKGKTTTTSLIYHILIDNNIEALLLGNMGIPAFSIIDKIKNNTILVMELSAHQLKYIHNSPHISILLNIFEEHLDHFGTFENYAEAKKNIFKNSSKADMLILGNQLYDKKTDFIKSANVNIINTELFNNKYYKQISCSNTISLKGEHNLQNIIIAIAAVKSVLSEKKISILDNVLLSSIEKFKPLAHRLEYVGKYNDIHFYNDSISTIPESAIAAINSIANINTIIIGGFDRGISYNTLIECLLTNANISNILLLGAVGKRIFEDIKTTCFINNIYDDLFFYKLDDNVLKCYSKNLLCNKYFYNNIVDLRAAVKVAYTVSAKGTSCLLSPAASSYDCFKNFEERGDKYKEYIKAFSKEIK